MLIDKFSTIFHRIEPQKTREIIKKRGQIHNINNKKTPKAKNNLQPGEEQKYIK